MPLLPKMLEKLKSFSKFVKIGEFFVAGVAHFFACIPFGCLL
jgi:hypothetical protein